jgi:PilZ domain
MELETRVSISFTLPGGGEELRLHAVVRNQHGFRCGLEFVRVSEAARTELVRYVGSIGESLQGAAKA